MATRCIIEVEGINFCKVYKHWDGYPDHMLPWLEAFNAKFTSERGTDSEYKIAQLLRFAALHASEYKLDSSETTGWGIIKYEDGYSANYVYTLKDDGTVKYKKMI